uniref:Uncharacterized protein n=1 Tax=Rhizophora mucronata TaxID=61149 RepID=A0A2P2QWC9_RHIMU
MVISFSPLMQNIKNARLIWLYVVAIVKTMSAFPCKRIH